MTGYMKIYLSVAILSTTLIFPFVLRAEVKTLERIDDPVVMECKVFSGLMGTPIDQLALMARHNDTWSPVPFQIDQKKPDGKYAFTMGPAAGPDPDPNLDGNDELVFMAKDSGDRLDGGPGPENSQAAMEIEITDPNNGKKAWLYLVRYSGKAPRSDKDYIEIEIDAAKNYRTIKSYEYVMGIPMDRVYPDMMAARKLANGRPGLDIIDRLKMPVEVEIIGGITIPFGFGDMARARDRGYIDGPVRIIHLYEAYLEFMGFIKIKGEGYSLVTYYVNNVIWPMKMDLPSNDLGIVRDIRIKGFLDFSPNAYGSHPFSAANPLHKDVVLDGVMSEAEKNLDRETEISWIGGFGPQGALVVRLYVFPVPNNIKLVTYYLDDKTALDPPEDFPGVSGVGYDIQGVKITAEQPSIHSITYYYFLSELKPEQVSRILDILDHPLKVRVNAVKAQAHQ